MKPHASEDFPLSRHNQIAESIVRYQDQSAWKHFAGAWNAVRYRYTAMAEYAEAFATSIKIHGISPAEPLRYQQDRDLFCFASNAVSVFDSFYYALYAFGALLRPNEFQYLGQSEEEEWKITIKSTKQHYQASFINDAIVQNLETLSEDNAFKNDLVGMRNFLVHRATPARHFQMGNPDKPPAVIRIGSKDIALDEKVTELLTAEARRLLEAYLASMESFVGRHLK
jgi:hypothetical protein